MTETVTLQQAGNQAYRQTGESYRKGCPILRTVSPLLMPEPEVKRTGWYVLVSADGAGATPTFVFVFKHGCRGVHCPLPKARVAVMTDTPGSLYSRVTFKGDESIWSPQLQLSENSDGVIVNLDINRQRKTKHCPKGKMAFLRTGKPLVGQGAPPRSLLGMGSS